MAANSSPGDSLSPFERRRLEELKTLLESDDPSLAATLREGRYDKARSVLLTVGAVITIAVLVLGAVIMFGFASVVGCLISAFTMYGIFKLCATADIRR
jgi:hypothetical protein